MAAAVRRHRQPSLPRSPDRQLASRPSLPLRRTGGGAGGSDDGKLGPPSRARGRRARAGCPPVSRARVRCAGDTDAGDSAECSRRLGRREGWRICRRRGAGTGSRSSQWRVAPVPRLHRGGRDRGGQRRHRGPPPMACRLRSGRDRGTGTAAPPDLPARRRIALGRVAPSRRRRQCGYSGPEQPPAAPIDRPRSPGCDTYRLGCYDRH